MRGGCFFLCKIKYFAKRFGYVGKKLYLCTQEACKGTINFANIQIFLTNICRVEKNVLILHFLFKRVVQ